MHSSPQAPERERCPVCRAAVSPGEDLCGACGARLADTPAQQIRSLNYLLSELSHWEDDGIIERARAQALRTGYEARLEEARAQLFTSRASARPPGALREAKTVSPAQENAATRPPAPPATPETRSITETHSKRRSLLETLADPHTIRLLLYTGAAMLVVGVVIWLRDVLYLKLQEPIVQAALLIIGTTIMTVAGWLTILRTRLRLTGRALTLTGSLLVPVNFWFLARSGLIENSGRAWLVCAFCAALYALTAAFLRERLYVYLASVAATSTLWAIIYRVESEAFGLYALSLVAVSILSLHLSRLFAVDAVDARPMAEASQSASHNLPSNYELWGPPLVYVALAWMALGLLFYMPLRLGSSSHTFADGLLHLRAGEYDPGVAMLLFFAASYATWFVGRYIFTKRRELFYTMSALSLFWTEFLAVDGFGVSDSVRLMLLATTTLVVASSARFLKGEASLPRALHRASLIVSVMLAPVTFAAMSDAPALTITHGAILALLAFAYAALSAPRFCSRAASLTLAYASALFASISFLVALGRANLQSETLYYALSAAWPFVLYTAARVSARLRRETQLASPFMLVADAEYALLLLFAAIGALALNQAPEDSFLSVTNLRGALLSVLAGASVYGMLRCWRDSSFFGAAIVPVALLLEVLILLGVNAGWFATAFALTLFPFFFAMSRYGRARGLEWLAGPSGAAAEAVLALVCIASMSQALIHLHVGDPLLLAPTIALAAVAALSLGASLRAEGRARVGYFRVGLFALIMAFALGALRAGYDPLGDVEIYSSPTALLLLVVAYLFARREQDEFADDTGLLLWAGSLLLAAPLLLHALQYRLFLDVAAPWRDLVSLCASLGLIIFGVAGRLRAPLIVGATALGLELLALSLTSVDWLQIPLKVYLISTGALILLVWGLLEFRREQILLVRRRISERRDIARERFGEWK